MLTIRREQPLRPCHACGRCNLRRSAAPLRTVTLSFHAQQLAFAEAGIVISSLTAPFSSNPAGDISMMKYGFVKGMLLGNTRQIISVRFGVPINDPVLQAPMTLLGAGADIAAGAMIYGK